MAFVTRNGSVLLNPAEKSKKKDKSMTCLTPATYSRYINIYVV